MADKKKIPPVAAKGEDPRPPAAAQVNQPTASNSDSWAIMAMLQQIAAEQTATSVRLTNLEQRQAQLAGGAGACGIACDSHGGGTTPVQQALAAERAKQSANVWLSREGPRAYIIRGSYHVPEQLSTEVLKQILRKIAHVNEQMAQQLREMANFDLKDFYPPMPAGCIPRPMAVEDHVSTFVAAVIAVVEHGTENAPPICTTRVDLLRVELQAAASQVSNYLSYHRPELAGDDGMLRECALNAGNDDLREAFSELTVMASDMRRRYPDNAPPSGAGPIFNPPKFRRLMTLVDEAHEMNLVAIGAMRKEQAEVAQAAQAQASQAPKAGQGGAQQVATRPRLSPSPRGEEGGILGKRKGPPALWGGTDKNMAPLQRPRMFGNGRMGPSAPHSARNGFARELAFWDVPRGACAHTWKGVVCRRPNCEFDHTRVHPDVAGHAAW